MASPADFGCFAVHLPILGGLQIALCFLHIAMQSLVFNIAWHRLHHKGHRIRKKEVFFERA